MSYIGRFAPSPTGPLHFGSLIAAVASYLDAKSQQGQWRLRIEDLDQTREIAGASDAILKTLAAYQFEWDGAVVYQHKRQAIYAEALHQLTQQQLIYPCTCSRKEVADSAHHEVNRALVYSGHCLTRPIKPNIPPAWRIKTNHQLIRFEDAVQGSQSQNLSHAVGDFVLKRADGYFAYQLAVVADDAEQGITHIVRGADLLDSTPRQIYLQQCLGYRTPRYAHIPVITNAQGEKLSKQTCASAIEPETAGPTLLAALTFLGQAPPADLCHATIAEIWQWAIAAWRLTHVPPILQKPIFNPLD